VLVLAYTALVAAKGLRGRRSSRSSGGLSDVTSQPGFHLTIVGRCGEGDSPPDLHAVLCIDMTEERPQPLQPHLVYTVVLELVGVVCVVAVLLAR
jgi:hypothetical protein